VSGTVIVGLDIGGSGVSCAAAELCPDGALDFIGFKKVHSSGVRHGEIVNVEQVSSAIITAVGEVGGQTGTAIKVVYTNLPSKGIAGYNASGVVTTKNGEVTREDVDAVIMSARAQTAAVGRKMLHVIPRTYSVDGHTDILDPRGMSGLRLASSVHIVTAPDSSYKNVVACLQRAGVSIAEVFDTNLSSKHAILHPEELNSGVALIDIGASTVNITVFTEGSPCHTSVIPVGGDYLTNDLVVGLRTSVSEAEKIKLQAQSCDINKAPAGHFKYLALDGKSEHAATNQIITHILSARVEEIMEGISQTLKASGKIPLLNAGIVFTGGTSHLPGLIDVASRTFGSNTPVRLVSGLHLNNATGIKTEMEGAPTCLGVVAAGHQHFIKNHRLMNPKRFGNGWASRLFTGAKKIFGET